MKTDLTKYTLKAILNDKRHTKIRVKEILPDSNYRLIDGSVVHESDIREFLREKIQK